MNIAAWMTMAGGVSAFVSTPALREYAVLYHVQLLPPTEHPLQEQAVLCTKPGED